MTVAYFNCFSGISGNMILGAFIHAGLDIEELKSELDKLPIGGYELVLQDTMKHGITAKYFNVVVTEKQPHRHLHHIAEIIKQAELPQEVKDLALKIFGRLAQAEAMIHGTTIEKVHFHEVGAVDAIIDIVGAAIGIYKLGITEVYASPLNVGKGMVKCAHGLMPIPAPATQELLKDAITYSNEVTGELVTPTGAAIITTLTKSFGDQPSLLVQKTGYGAGTWDLSIPNVLRLTLGNRVVGAKEKEQVKIIETNIDDMNPEFYDYLMDKLFAAGAVDVYYQPIQMKKNRPGTLVSITSTLADNTPILKVLFEESTTLGVRMYSADREVLTRSVQEVESPWGKVRVKISKYQGQIVNIKPEYLDCKQIAEKSGLPLKEIWQRIHHLAISNLQEN